MEMLLRSYGDRQLLSELWNKETGRGRRLDVFLWRSKQRQILYELWSEEAGRSAALPL